MLFLSIVLIFAAGTRALLVLMNSANWVHGTSSFCVQLLPEVSAHSSALASLLCGQKVTDAILLSQLRQTALLHLFVVSGAHLIELERLLETCRLPKIIRVAGGVGFTLLSGAQPPIVRALTGLLLPARVSGRSNFFVRWRSNARSDTTVLHAGCLTLAMVPMWVHSISLALSWACAFAISLPLGSGWRGALRRTIAVWICLTPLLAPWGLASPMTWILNLVVAPVFAAVSLPLAFLALLGGPFVTPFDRFMDIFLWLLAQIANPSATAEMNSLWPEWSWWLWIGALHFIAHVWLTSKRRTG